MSKYDATVQEAIKKAMAEENVDEVMAIVKRNYGGGGAMSANADLEELRGTIVYIQTTTFHFIGKAVEIGDKYIKLERGVCLLESGMLGTVLSNGYDEHTVTEMYPQPVHINRENIIAITTWNGTDYYMKYPQR